MGSDWKCQLTEKASLVWEGDGSVSVWIWDGPAGTPVSRTVSLGYALDELAENLDELTQWLRGASGRDMGDEAG